MAPSAPPGEEEAEGRSNGMLATVTVRLRRAVVEVLVLLLLLLVRLLRSLLLAELRPVDSYSGGSLRLRKSRLPLLDVPVL